MMKEQKEAKGSEGKLLRMRRIWKNPRAVIIPLDHGGYSGVPKGLEDPAALVERIAGTGADAILVTPGVLPKIVPCLGNLGVILRLDGAFTAYTPVAGDYESVCSVEHAVQLGVDAGIVFTFVGTTFDSASLRRLGATAEDSARWGLPLISEVLAPSLLNDHFEREVFKVAREGKSDVERETVDVARIAAEHGADIIKTRYSGSVSSFREAVRACPSRILVAGGPVANRDGESLLRFASECVQAEASGIVFGRTVWQHPKADRLIEALCAIVHEEASVPSAMKLLR